MDLLALNASIPFFLELSYSLFQLANFGYFFANLTPPLNTPRRGAYATNSQVRHAACVCKDSLSDTRCFVRTVYAVFPPDTHGEVRVQYTLKSYTPTSSQDLKSNCYPGIDICIYVYVYVCMYVLCMCVCVYVCVCACLSLALSLSLCVCVCVYVIYM